MLKKSGWIDNDEDINSYVKNQLTRKQGWNFFLLDPQHMKLLGKLCFFFLVLKMVYNNIMDNILDLFKR